MAIKETGGIKVPSKILADDLDGLCGFGTSRLAETAFGRLEDESRGHKSGRLGPVARMHRLVANDELGEDDMPQLKPSLLDKAASLRKMPQHFFSAVRAKFSLGENAIQKVLHPEVTGMGQP